MRHVLAVVVLVLAGCGGSSGGSCPTADVTITSSSQFAEFSALGCTSVSGALTIAGTDLTSVVLPRLTKVTALYVTANGALAELNLPALADGQVHLTGNPVLTSVNLPSLAAAEVAVEGNASLSALSLPAFGSGRVVITGNASLASVSLPELTQVFLGLEVGLDVSANALLSSLVLPKLASGNLRIAGTGLTSLSLPLFFSGGVGVAGNPAMTSISLPALTGTGPAGLFVADNVTLTTMELPALATVHGPLTITGNTAYPQCAAEAILAQLGGPTGTATISGNDTSATCPP